MTEFRIVNIYNYVSKVNCNLVFHMLIKHVEKCFAPLPQCPERYSVSSALKLTKSYCLGGVFSFQYVISQRNDRIKLPCLRTVVHAAYISSQGRNRKVGLRAELVILRSFVMAVALFAVIKPFYEP